MAWQHVFSNTLFDEIRDLNNGERAVMKMWNHFIDTSGNDTNPRGTCQHESVFANVCLRFIQLYGKFIRCV